MNLVRFVCIQLWSIVALFTACAGNAGAQTGQTKSIGAWVKCGANTDEFAGVARAIASARHSAFTLLVDCPVRLHMGMDIERTIFIDDGTAVEFSGAGKFIIDNVFHPAFVIADSSNITLANWNLEYDASLPVDMKTGGYERGGQHIATGANAPAAGAFTDLTMTHWLTANRNIVFDKSRGNVGATWPGPTNSSAVFYLTGDTGNVKVTGMKLHAPAAAGGDRFVPMAFSMTSNYKSNQRVDATTPRTSQYLGLPHDLVFADIDLDGYYMGWQGNSQNSTFERIRAHRSADLQDSSGSNVGGVGKWFAPPHLFYLNYQPTGDPGMFNRNIHIVDVVDSGPRVGQARDKGGSDHGSGFAMSLKIGCANCSVDHYKSNKPDGFADILSSDNLVVSNVEASYDSSFLNDQYSGWRFPQGPLRQITFKNVVFKDVAATSIQPPLSGENQASNEGIVFSNVRIQLNHWAGKGSVLPVLAGSGNSIDLEYSISADSQHLRWQ